MMYSFQGLENWELVFVSGMAALIMLTISSLIGFGVAHLVLREPATVKQPATSARSMPVPGIPTGGLPVPAAAVEPRGLVMG